MAIKHNIILKWAAGIFLLVGLYYIGSVFYPNAVKSINNTIVLFNKALLSPFVPPPASFKIKPIDFVIYAPSPSFFTEQSLTEARDKRSIDLEVAYIKSSFPTSRGPITFGEAKLDSNLKHLFIPPDRCDYVNIQRYISVWGKYDYNNDTSLKCEVVYQSGQTVVMKTLEDSGYEGEAPFIARIGDTIIVFKAYSSSSEFDGTPEEAQKYILNFIKNSKPIDKTLLNLP